MKPQEIILLFWGMLSLCGGIGTIKWISTLPPGKVQIAFSLFGKFYFFWTLLIGATLIWGLFLVIPVGILLFIFRA